MIGYFFVSIYVGIFLSNIFFYYTILNNSIDNNIKIQKCSDNYMYCSELNKIYLKKKIDKINYIKFKDFKNKQQNYTNFLLKCKNNHNDKYQNILNDINNFNHIYFWLQNNQLLQFKNLSYIILNLETVYNYKENKIDELKLQYIDIFCHKNKIIFLIIGELEPEKLFNIKPPFFNKNNYISPYHYKTSFLSNPERIIGNKYNKKSVSVTINKIIQDLKNRNGLKDNYIYLGQNNISNVKLHMF